MRIYRRNRERREALVGVVEVVGAREKKAFTDRDELWRILTARKSRQPEDRRPR